MILWRRYVIIPTRRSSAEALHLMATHALGEAGSPYFIGLLADVSLTISPKRSNLSPVQGLASPRQFLSIIENSANQPIISSEYPVLQRNWLHTRIFRALLPPHRTCPLYGVLQNSVYIERTETGTETSFHTNRNKEVSMVVCQQLVTEFRLNQN
jgi:hypothetical protein